MPKYQLVKSSIKHYLLLTQLQAWFLCIKVVCTEVNNANARNRNFLFLTYNFFSPPSTPHLVPVPRSFFQVESRLVKTAPPSFPVTCREFPSPADTETINSCYPLIFLVQPRYSMIRLDENRENPTSQWQKSTNPGHWRQVEHTWTRNSTSTKWIKWGRASTYQTAFGGQIFTLWKHSQTDERRTRADIAFGRQK